MRYENEIYNNARRSTRLYSVTVSVQHLHGILDILLALGGRSWPSQMHEVTYDFLVAHIKASQKKFG